MSMYGTRDAAKNWSEEYSKCLTSAGFDRGIANPCLFKHKSKDIQIVVHGDDFMAAGDAEDLKEVEELLSNKYKITSNILGPDAGQLLELRILNRIIRWCKDGLRIEADPRHAEMVVQHYGLEESTNSVKTAGVKEVKKKDAGDDGESESEQDESPLMSPASAKEHRGLAARLNYMMVDRADCQYARTCKSHGDSNGQRCRKGQANCTVSSGKAEGGPDIRVATRDR